MFLQLAICSRFCTITKLPNDVGQVDHAPDQSGETQRAELSKANKQRGPANAVDVSVRFQYILTAHRVKVLVLGLDNAGKSALLHALAPHSPESPHSPSSPDVPARFQSSGVKFSARDVAGAGRLRPLWERHYDSTDAIIFVVDAADHLRLVVSRDELQLVTSHPTVQSRRPPLLVLANKSDHALALTPLQVAAGLSLERLSVPAWHVCATSAVSGAGLQEGIAWLAAHLHTRSN